MRTLGEDIGRALGCGAHLTALRRVATGPFDTTRCVKIEALEAMLHREREALAEVRADRDAWKQQATALLAAPPKRRSWWPW